MFRSRKVLRFTKLNDALHTNCARIDSQIRVLIVRIILILMCPFYVYLSCVLRVRFYDK